MLDMYQIPHAFSHYKIVSSNFPAHPETDLVIDVENRTIYPNMEADPNANITRTVFPHHFAPDSDQKKKWWGGR